MRIAIMLMTGAALITASGAATAQVTYTYTGSPFSTATGAYSTSDMVTGSFVLAAPLSVGGNNVTPISFSFSDGLQSINNSGSVGDFSLSMNAAGHITSWFVLMFTNASTIDYPDFIESVGGPSGNADTAEYGLGNEAYNNAAGSWTTPPQAAPEIDATFAASGLAFLVGWLMVLLGRRPERPLA